MRYSIENLQNARSLLFVPGNRSDRFPKAVASGADCVILDLEDSVGPPHKAAALDNTKRWLADGGLGVVRINGTGTPWHDDDLTALRGRCPVLLPKANSPEQVATVIDQLGPHTPVIVLIETAAGILNARDICSVPGVVRALFGNHDLARELSIDAASWIALAPARAHVVIASAAAGLVPPIDGPTAALTDRHVIDADSHHAAELGYTAKSCVHPKQVPVVNKIFSPSDDEIRWAKEVISAAGDGSATALNNQIIGKPVVDRARRLLARTGIATPV